MNPRMKQTILCALVCVALLAPSCRGTRGLHTEGRALPYRQWTKQMQEAETPFATLNTPSIDVTAEADGKRVNVTAALRVYTDSVVMLSIIPFLGIEMFTVELYPDRWMLYDRVNRTYYTESYEYFDLKWGVQVDFAAVQSLFTTRIYSATVRGTDAKDWTYTPLDAGRAAIERTAGDFTQRLTASAAHTVEQVVWSTSGGQYRFTADFTDYAVSRGVNYPRRIAFALTSGGTPLARVGMTLRRVSFNGELRLNPADPARYKRGNVAQLGNLLQML